MFWIIKNIDTNYLFLISIFPILGLLISNYLNKKNSIVILMISVLLFSFILTGFYILTRWFYVFCFVIIISIVFSYFIGFTNKNNKLTIAITLTIFLLIFSSFIHLFDSFGGYEQIEYSRRKKNYKIQCTLIQGFSGKAVTKYYLYYSPLWGLVNKNIQTIRIDPFEPSKDCILKFSNNGVIFNTCTREFVTTP